MTTMLQATKIIGTVLAITALIGAGIWIGVVLSALILGVGRKFPLKKFLTETYTNLKWVFNSFPKPHAFSGLCLKGGGTVNSALALTYGIALSPIFTTAGIHPDVFIEFVIQLPAGFLYYTTLDPLFISSVLMDPGFDVIHHIGHITDCLTNTVDCIQTVIEPSFACINETIVLDFSKFDFNFDSQIRAIQYYFYMLNNYLATKGSMYTVGFNHNYCTYGYSHLHTSNIILGALHRYLCFILPLLVYLSWLSGNNFFRVFSWLVTTLTIIISNTRSHININNIILILMFIAQAGAAPTASPDLVCLIRTYITWLGCASYLATNTVYDRFYRSFVNIGNRQYFSIRNRFVNRDLIVARLRIGGVYYVNIFLGVIASTTFFYLYYPNSLTYQILALVLSLFLSYTSSTVWLWLGRASMHEIRYENWLLRFITSGQWRISFFRSSSETIAFFALSWATFTIWNFWSTFGLSYWISFAVGLGAYLFSGYIQMGMETDFTNLPLYGLDYMLSFASLAISTNGLIFGLLDLIGGPYRITLTVATGLMILGLPMEYYRIPHRTSDVTSTTPGNRYRTFLFNLRVRLAAMLYLYALFFSFAFHTYSIFGYMWFM